MDVNKLYHDATHKLRKGRPEKAEKLIKKILSVNPDHADASHLLGIIAAKQNNFSVAGKYFETAIRNNTHNPLFHYNYGRVLHAQGFLEEALAAFEQAIRENSGYAEAHDKCSIVLNAMGKTEKALAASERAILLNPQFSEAYCHYGVNLRESGRLQEAMDFFARAIRLKPQFAEAYCNRGNVLSDLGLLREAVQDYEKAISINPRLIDAYCNNSVSLRDMGRLEDAGNNLRNAFELDSDNAEAYYILGTVQEKSGRLDAAESSFRRAIELKPDYAGAHTNLLYLLAARAKLTPDRMMEEQRDWDRMHGEEGRIHSLASIARKDVSGQRLKIGYVSSDFRQHAVSYFFEPLLSAHDRTHFEIFCYASHKQHLSDEVTERLRNGSEHWCFVCDMSDAELAQKINEDGINILVDLAGYTSGNRLKAFTYKPAPVQASYLGFFSSTGLGAMDYWITDEVLHPADTCEKTNECIIRLPRCSFCYLPPDEAPAVAPRHGVDNQLVFGSFSHISKLTAETIETWSRLLQRLPESSLLIMDKSLGELRILNQLIQQFEDFGIPEGRLQLREGLSFSRYLDTYAEVDIVLDPFPRTGGTTTAEALWMGLPVISLAGKRYVERISASELTAVGLQDLIVYTRADYIDKAVLLACDPVRRAELRTNLRAKMLQSPFCDDKSLAQSLEAVYEKMWERYISDAQ